MNVNGTGMMGMIKILQILPALGSGGIEKLILQWESQIKQNDMTYVFAVYAKGGAAYDKLIDKGYHIYEIKQVKSVGIRQYLKQIRTIIREEKIDIVHSNAGTLTWLAMLAAKKENVSVRILHAHTNQYNMPQNKYVRRTLTCMARCLNSRYSTLRLACSDEAGKYCFGKHPYTLLKNGIELEKFKYSKTDRDNIRNQFGFTNDQFVIGFIGRLAEQKNPIFALEIYKELQKEKNTAMLIVGEGPMEMQMKEWSRKNGLSNVYFVGRKEDIPRWYNAMDVFLFPSLYEGLGIVAIEAQVTGLPVYISEFVPEDVMLTELVHEISLQKPAAFWAKQILQDNNKLVERKSKTSALRESGYDKKETVAQMMAIYKKEFYGTK
jgi:glycosyltransferase involved in cell wall biosynthesis